MRIALLALALLIAAPVAKAQVVIHTPGPRVAVVDYDYWRQGERAEWRRRHEFREEAFRRRDWVRSHCVRDWQGGQYCRP